MVFLYSKWRAIDLSKRIQIAQALGIKKVGPTHVRDNIVESDGYLIDDVENALTLENLQKYLDTTETNMDTLWEWLTKGKPEVIVPVTSSEVIPLTTTKVTSTKHAKTKKSK